MIVVQFVVVTLSQLGHLQAGTPPAAGWSIVGMRSGLVFGPRKFENLEGPVARVRTVS